MGDDGFELAGFTPYLLNRAAEAQSLNFSAIYKERYGMLRTEWRVLFHLGRYGAMTAKEISERSSIHKTKISRAVRALEKKRFLTREINPQDRRAESLDLRPPGKEAFDYLVGAAAEYEGALTRKLGQQQMQQLKHLLEKLGEA